MVRPGALTFANVNTLVEPNQPQNLSAVWEWDNGQHTQYLKTLNSADDVNTAVSKRLDALDAELKQLRTAVEEFTKAGKTLEELNKAAAALNKAIEDGK